MVTPDSAGLAVNGVEEGVGLTEEDKNLGRVVGVGLTMKGVVEASRGNTISCGFLDSLKVGMRLSPPPNVSCCSFLSLSIIEPCIRPRPLLRVGLGGAAADDDDDPILKAMKL